MWYNKGTTSNRMLVIINKEFNMNSLDLFLEMLEKKEELAEIKIQRRREWVRTHLIRYIAKRWYKYRTHVGRYLDLMIRYLDMETALEEAGFIIEDYEGRKVIAKFTFDEEGGEITHYRP